MMKSMTGFGRAEAIDKQKKITVELKSVNHRYLDLNMKMPKKLGMFEAAVRNLLKEYIQRGKVDVYVTYENFSENSVALHYNRELAKEYVSYLRQMGEEFCLRNDLTATTLSRYPEVLTLEEKSVDEDAMWDSLSAVVRDAAKKLVEARCVEGQNLKVDLEGKLNVLDQKVCMVEERSPQVVLEYRRKLEAKTRELLEDSQIDENRIAAEVVLFSDKICNDEETVRLHSHISSMLKNFETGDGIGRKMDFIAQEMNREANTILSKANDMEVSNLAIDLKTEIEKIREQIQNIE